MLAGFLGHDFHTHYPGSMARRRYSVEAACKRDLSRFPPYMRTSGPAIAMLALARRFDLGVSARDATLLAREIRLCLRTLSDLAPAALPNDPVDEIRAARERRMLAEAEPT
jgi:hypothetical protein